MDVPMKFEALESSYYQIAERQCRGVKALLAVPCYSIKGFPCRVVVVRFILSLSGAFSSVKIVLDAPL